MPSHQSDDRPIRGVYDTAEAHHRPNAIRMNSPTALYQERQENGDGAGMMVNELEEPGAQQVQMPNIVDQSHLPLGDLERIIDYVATLSFEAGLTVDQVERVTYAFVLTGNHNHWDIDTMEMVAREIIPRLRNEQAREPGDGGDDNFFAPELIHELWEGRRLVPDRRNALIRAAEHELTNAHDDPPPRYTRTPAAPRHGVEVPGIEVPETRYSIRFGSSDTTHFQAEIIVSFTLLRAIAYGGIAGAALAVTKGIICTVFGCEEPISSAIRGISLQLLDQVMAGWELFCVGLDGLRSFTTALASADSRDVIVDALRLTSLLSLFYMFGRVTCMVVYGVASML